MPNFLRVAVAVLLAGVTSGCVDPADDDEFVILTTFTVIGDMVENVAGDRARVESLTRVGAEVHGFEPTPSDIARAYEADLIIDNGLGLEAWFADFVSGVDAPRVTLADVIEPIPLEGSDAPNPHAWMSPRNAILYVNLIADTLTDIDPGGADIYRANADAYIAELDAFAAEMDTRLAQIPPASRVLVTCEGAFSYLAADAGLEEVYLWPVNAEADPTPRDIAETIERVRLTDVPAVFCESTVSSDTMNRVVAETDARFGGTLYVDSLSTEDGPVPTYLALLRHTVDTIATGLGAP